MYRDDRAMSDGMEHLSEETSDEAERPLTLLCPELQNLRLLSLEFGQRCWVRSCVRHWLQLIGCATLLMVASNFGGLDRVGESRVGPRRSLRQMRAS